MSHTIDAAAAGRLEQEVRAALRLGGGVRRSHLDRTGRLLHTRCAPHGFDGGGDGVGSDLTSAHLLGFSSRAHPWRATAGVA